MKHRLAVLGIVALVAALLLVGGCSSASTPPKSEGGSAATTESAASTATLPYAASSVKVTVTTKATLPKDVRIVVSIADITNPAAPTVLADKTIDPGAPLPVDVVVDYDAKKVDQTHTYTIHVVVKNDAGAVLAATKTAYPVLTKGAKPAPVTVEVSAP